MAQTVQPTNSSRNGTLVWAFILIAVGVIWLLWQVGVFTGENIAVLVRLWPLVLIGIGVQLLVGRRSRGVSIGVIGGTFVLLVALMFVGPSLGWGRNMEIKTMTVSEPLGDAEGADVTLGVGVGRATVYALRESDDLIAADLRYAGDVKYDVELLPVRRVELIEIQTSGGVNLNFLDWMFRVNEDELRWDVGLTPSVPIDLTITGGVGSSHIDLTGLQITSLRSSTGVGETRITLPDSAGIVPVNISGGVGKTILVLNDGSLVDARMSGGVGETEIDVPEGAAVRIDARSGLGNLNFPSDWTRVNTNDGNEVWESPAYAGADREARSEIEFDGGVGVFRVY